jgi:uncharacterized protein YdaT
MANLPKIHVSQTDDGRWQAKKESGQRASLVAETQAEAIEGAKKIAKNEGSTVVVHGRDGKIRSL